MKDTVIQLNEIRKDYGDINIFCNLSCAFHRGEFSAITGSSGKGKTSFLHLVGLLDNAFEGDYRLFSKDVHMLSGKEKNHIRNMSIGFIFQNYHLIPGMNAKENILLPALYNRKKQDFSKRLLALSNSLFPSDLFGRDIRLLSGGEQQRIAIARALLMDPPILLADEPTGNLDPHNTEIVIRCFEKLRDEGKTILMATHDDRLLKRCDKVISI